MKKVLHVIRNIGMGGTEKYMLNLINNTNNKYENIILTYDKNIDSSYKINNKILFIDNPHNTGLIKNYKSIKNIIKNNNIDIVYSYTHYNSGLVMLAAKICHVKIRITHSHRSESTGRNGIFNFIYKSFLKLLINLFANVKIACGIDAAKSLFYNVRKVCIINNGIDINLYSFKKNSSLRNKYGIEKDDFVIGTVGHLDKNKNQKFLIDVFSEFHKIKKNSKLLIIGDGEEKEKLIEQVKLLGLNENVIFTGNINNVYDLYNIMDVFCLTSYKEGLPYVLIEAQTNGLKCYVSMINSSDNKRLINTSIIKEKGYSLVDNINKIIDIYENRK